MKCCSEIHESDLCTFVCTAQVYALSFQLLVKWTIYSLNQITLLDLNTHSEDCMHEYELCTNLPCGVWLLVALLTMLRLLFIVLTMCNNATPPPSLQEIR